VKITIETVSVSGTTHYRATGRRHGKMTYQRTFEDLQSLSNFVNRSAGQSIRRRTEYMAAVIDQTTLEVASEAYDRGFNDGVYENSRILLVKAGQGVDIIKNIEYSIKASEDRAYRRSLSA
jgi:hypothetical protein